MGEMSTSGGSNKNCTWSTLVLMQQLHADTVDRTVLSVYILSSLSLSFLNYFFLPHVERKKMQREQKLETAWNKHIQSFIKHFLKCLNLWDWIFQQLLSVTVIYNRGKWFFFLNVIVSALKYKRTFKFYIIWIKSTFPLSTDDFSWNRKQIKHGTNIILLTHLLYPLVLLIYF